MRAHQIMTRRVLTVVASSSIVQAANIMLKNHVSGLPVVDHAGGWSVSFRKVILSAVRRLGPNESGRAG